MLLNAEEMQFIVDELFVGNKLAAGEIVTSDGTRIDLRNIRSPIIVFCSKADNITPPQQALGWILDLYESVDEISAHGQTIVYSVHETDRPSRHLRLGRGRQEGARRVREQHRLDRRAAARPLRGRDGRRRTWRSRTPILSPATISCASRRARSTTSARSAATSEDERRFAAAARLSEINLGLYRTFVQPLVRACRSRRWPRHAQLHPLGCSTRCSARATPERMDRRDSRACARRAPAGLARQHLPQTAGTGFGADRAGARGAGAMPPRSFPNRRFMLSMARRPCRPRSASIRVPGLPAQGREEPASRRPGRVRIADLRLA